MSVPEVLASASTSISDLQYPHRIVQGASKYAQGIPVTFTVSWAGASKGDSLLAAISDFFGYGYAGDWVDGRANCMNAWAPGEKASCAIRNIADSGHEQISFLVAQDWFSSRPRPGKYSLLASAWLANSPDKSLSRELLSFEVVSELRFHVTVPVGVTLTIDGSINKTSVIGSVYAYLKPGAHVISVPDVVSIDDSTRLRFDHWPDGVTNASRTVTLDDDTQFDAIYVKQFRLTVTNSCGNATGAGWYDEESNASFSVVAVQPMSGLLGVLGGKCVFDHWSGDSSAKTTTASVTMDAPRTVASQSRADNTTPYALFGASVVIIASVLLLITRGRGFIRQSAG